MVTFSAKSQRDAFRWFPHRPQPSIWVAERLQNGVRAKGLAGEIPANRWWRQVDSNHGPLPYQRCITSWREDLWRLAVDSTFGLGQGAAHDCRSQGHSGSVSRRGSANMPHAVACISPVCRWIAMHVHPTPAGASGHRWLGSPAAEEPNLAIVRCAGHRRQAHSAANIPPTCLMSRRASPRLWVDLRACSPTPVGAPDRHSNSVGGITCCLVAFSRSRKPLSRCGCPRVPLGSSFGDVGCRQCASVIAYASAGESLRVPPRLFDLDAAASLAAWPSCSSSSFCGWMWSSARAAGGG
jgi:hypothetical protein